MPDTFARWFDAHEAALDAEIARDDAYRAGWRSCMAWESRVPPDELSAEAREMWFQGFDDAMDSPLGSGPDL